MHNSRNIKLTIEYDGTNYFGWQRQLQRATIQEVLEEAVERITRERPSIISSGRTDAGVHALGQAANFRTGCRLPLTNLLLGLNSILPDDIAIKRIEEVGADFHARFSAKTKTYVYRIYNQPVRSALERNFSWFIHDPLDIVNMREAAGILVGTWNFLSFCGSGHNLKKFVRTVFRAELDTDEKGVLRFLVEADGFLRYMVRNIVGTLVYVGKGRFAPEAIKDIIMAEDRRQAGPTAPPQGLFLTEVKY